MPRNRKGDIQHVFEYGNQIITSLSLFRTIPEFKFYLWMCLPNACLHLNSECTWLSNNQQKYSVMFLLNKSMSMATILELIYKV